MDKIKIENASEPFFGRAQGKPVSFDIEETRKRLFGGERKRQGSIMIDMTDVRPEGGKDCWVFTGLVLSRKGPFKYATTVEGFYRGPNGNVNPGWRDDVSFMDGAPKTGWLKPVA